MTITTSAYDGDTITVDQVVNDPTWIKREMDAALRESFIDEYLFVNGGSNSGVIAYEIEASPYLDGGYEPIEEFGEIPVYNPQTGEIRKTVGAKHGHAIEVSLEMQRFNKVARLQRALLASQNTMIRGAAARLTRSVEAAETLEQAASKAWAQPDADPIGDIYAAQEQIAGAGPEGGYETDTFGYVPDVMVMGYSTMLKLIANRDVSDRFKADMQLSDPLLSGVQYRGLQSFRICGLGVVTSSFIKPGEVLITQRNRAGFYSDGIPLTTTPLYSERGNSGYGGATQSWRQDTFMHRAIAIDAPKAICRITGVV